MAILSVLLVEDEPMIALMVADIVEAQGLGVAGVFRANAEALCFLHHCRPDAAIVDYSLADLVGGQPSERRTDSCNDVSRSGISAHGQSLQPRHDPTRGNSRALVECKPAPSHGPGPAQP
jgi:CheY-like chemotaxis protein